MHFRDFATHNSITRIEEHDHCSVGDRLGNGTQIVGDDAPAHPAFHPVVAMVEAAVELMPPFQPADAPFNASAPIAPAPKPALLLMGDALGRFRSRLRQHYLLDAMQGGIPLVRGGVDPAIAREQPRWTMKHAQMMLHTRRQLSIFGRIPLQNRVAAHNAPVDLIEPDDTPKFRGTTRLTFANDRG